MLKKNIKIAPINDENDDENWETLIDFTEFKEGGIEINELIEVLNNI